MTTMLMEQAPMRIAVPTLGLAALAFAMLAGAAEAQTRQFACGGGRFVTVTVSGPNTVVAGPLDGQMMTLVQSPNDPLHFLNGDYGVVISPDQTRIQVEVPEDAGLVCVFGAGGNAQRPPPAPPRPQPPPPPPQATGQGPSRQFFCGEDSFVTVTVSGPNTVFAGPIDGQMMTLVQSPNDPLHFLNGDYGIIISPDQLHIQVEIPDFGQIGCQFGAGAGVPQPPPAVAAPTPQPAQPVGFPIEAKSWGGSVRAGPSINAQKIGSLPEGERITLLEQANAPFFQDRPWFRISFRGQTGYQWGGIICPIGRPVPGTFEVCN